VGFAVSLLAFPTTGPEPLDEDAADEAVAAERREAIVA
jgi:hypothetical protein